MVKVVVTLFSWSVEECSRTSLIKEVGAAKMKNMISIIKEGGPLSYQVSVLTPTNYSVWEVKVNSIMDSHSISETVESNALDENSDQMKSKQALFFQAIPEDMVLQMASYTDPIQVWDGLKTWYLGVDRWERLNLQP